jgi:hypothetical protein
VGLEPGLNSAEKAKRVTASRRIAQVETELMVSRPATVLLKEATTPRRLLLLRGAVRAVSTCACRFPVWGTATL